MSTIKDTKDDFACPGCGSAMVAGVVVGRSPGVKFEPNTDVFGDLGGIKLTRGFFHHRADALRCPTCGIVVIFPESCPRSARARPVSAGHIFLQDHFMKMITAVTLACLVAGGCASRDNVRVVDAVK
jgi:predicted RNA-binding Zn-ribbon protein involved in translation (DUF1610 family)